jgi:uncharacterized membrane protein YfcA
MLIGHPQRVFLYWRDINWAVTAWYLPGAIIGSILGAFTFTQIKLDWLSILLAICLLASTLTYGREDGKQSFFVRLWYFIPSGFVTAFLSGLIGSAGPLLNPLYLNYGLAKQQLIATKSVNILVIHVVKIITYWIFGALNHSHLVYGLLIGAAALPGNLLGQMVLNRISEQRFRQLLVSFVVLSGIVLLWNDGVSLLDRLLLG